MCNGRLSYIYFGTSGSFWVISAPSLPRPFLMFSLISENGGLSCCCWCWSGLGAKAPVAQQPLDLLYTLFSRSSHCRRQMSPRSTRLERSKQRVVELKWARKGSREFCLNADFHVTFRDLLHAANLRHGAAGFTSPPKEGVLGIFSPWKIRRLRPSLNSRIWMLSQLQCTRNSFTRLLETFSFNLMSCLI
jgi:hypothetical protein